MKQLSLLLIFSMPALYCAERNHAQTIFKAAQPAKLKEDQLKQSIANLDLGKSYVQLPAPVQKFDSTYPVSIRDAQFKKEQIRALFNSSIFSAMEKMMDEISSD